MNLRTIGVVGAGVIGTGVAEALAGSGFDVIAVDVSVDRLERAEREVRRQLRLTRLLGKRPAAPADDVLARIRWSTDLGDLARADFAIENVTEDWGIKQRVYAELDRCCRPEVVFAANTSCIPITRIGAATERPTQVLGIHFMNPVPLVDTVEVIRGYHTSDETLTVARGLLSRMGKEAVVVKDAPGFVSNRVLMLTINEAIGVLQDGVATHAEIDRIFTRCFGHKMGPLETADLIGLDTILRSIQALYDDFGDPKFRPSPLLRKMVDAGLLGRKSGQGFYAYGLRAGIGSGGPRTREEDTP
jgi:3-hydroxybutyryl-CoA dehydrogenase